MAIDEPRPKSDYTCGDIIGERPVYVCSYDTCATNYGELPNRPRIEPKKGRAAFAKFFAKDVKRRAPK